MVGGVMWRHGDGEWNPPIVTPIWSTKKRGKLHALRLHVLEQLMRKGWYLVQPWESELFSSSLTPLRLATHGMGVKPDET